MKENPHVVEELIAWFKLRLARSDVQFGDELLSYESNSAYDIQFYQLQKEAAEYWQQHHGYVPTPGQIMQGFFGAEYERFRKAKIDSLPWTDRLKLNIGNAFKQIPSQYNRLLKGVKPQNPNQE